MNKRNKLRSTKLVSVLSVIWQHASTSERHIQASSNYCIRRKNCVKIHCTPFLLYILYYWHEWLTSSKLYTIVHNSYVFLTTSLKMTLWGRNKLPN